MEIICEGCIHCYNSHEFLNILMTEKFDDDEGGVLAYEYLNVGF